MGWIEKEFYYDALKRAPNIRRDLRVLPHTLECPGIDADALGLGTSSSSSLDDSMHLLQALIYSTYDQAPHEQRLVCEEEGVVDDLFTYCVAGEEKDKNYGVELAEAWLSQRKRVKHTTWALQNECRVSSEEEREMVKQCLGEEYITAITEDTLYTFENIPSNKRIVGVRFLDAEENDNNNDHDHDVSSLCSILLRRRGTTSNKKRSRHDTPFEEDSNKDKDLSDNDRIMLAPFRRDQMQSPDDDAIVLLECPLEASSVSKIHVLSEKPLKKPLSAACIFEEHILGKQLLVLPRFAPEDKQTLLPRPFVSNARPIPTSHSLFPLNLLNTSFHQIASKQFARLSGDHLKTLFYEDYETKRSCLFVTPVARLYKKAMDARRRTTSSPAHGSKSDKNKPKQIDELFLRELLSWFKKR